MSLLTTLAAGGAAALLVTGVAGVTVLGSAGPASAGTSVIAAGSSANLTDVTASTGDGDVDFRFERVCARVPVALARVQRIQTRFAADASTPGSIAYLEARIDKAKAAGQTDVVQLLTDRLTVRKDLDGILPDRLKQLQDAQRICAAHGKSATSPAAPSASPAA